MTPLKTPPSWFSENGIEDATARTTEGITEDYVWFESEAVLRELDGVASRFKKLASVMQARHNEHLKILRELLDENRALKAELKAKQ
jgi:hypothetical protein